MHKTWYSSSVHASLETVWNLMVQRVEKPHGSHPTIEQIRILQQYSDGVLREVSCNGMLLKEKVVLDQPHGEIHFFLIDHPLYSGRVVHRVVPTSVQNPVAPQLLTIEVHWTPKDGHAEQVLEATLPGQIQGEVLALKEAAETQDREISSIRTPYAFGRTLSLSFSQGLRKVRAELEKQGFQILSELDVRQNFKQKLHREFSNYMILSVINPALAYQLLGIRLELGTLLPCNVAVYPGDNGKSVVMALDPVATLSPARDTQSAALAATVKEKLERVLSAL